jgi:hypothetical protein
MDGISVGQFSLPIQGGPSDFWEAPFEQNLSSFIVQVNSLKSHNIINLASN